MRCDLCHLIGNSVDHEFRMLLISKSVLENYNNAFGTVVDFIKRYEIKREWKVLND